MIKSELIARLADRYPEMPRHDVERVVAAILECLSKSLSAGDRVELRGFGTFKVETRPSHMGRSPKTGEVIAVKQKRKVYFRTSGRLLKRMNEPAARRDKDSVENPAHRSAGVDGAHPNHR
jgi:integration host factor subunit beta